MKEGGEQRSRRARAGLELRRDMKVLARNARATTNLGPNGEILTDDHYKLECPVLRERRIAKGGDINIECLYMRRVIDSTILKLRRGRKARQQERGQKVEVP